MSIGLPAHLAPQASRRAFVAAQHAVAATMLCLALATSLVIQSAHPTEMVWPAALALTPPLALLAVHERLRAPWWGPLYLFVGAIAIYVHASILLVDPMPVDHNEGFSFISVKVALVLVGCGGAAGVGSSVLWTIAGYLVAEFSIGAAILAQGTIPWRFDVPTFVALLATLAILPLVGHIHRRQLGVALPRLHRAAQDEQVAAMRYRIEVKAATLMHDTVLNHLAAIAESQGDQLDPLLTRQINQDVESLAGEEWLAETSETVDEKSRSDWQHSGLFTAIQESRLMGLEVETTGDLAAVGLLGRECSVALGLAVKQCLVNVLKHSGELQAEVAVFSSDAALSVMVIDNGKGFSEAATGSDRLGLRSSVRKRMELMGGQVNVWSTPGRGTSIMIKIPLAATSAPIDDLDDDSLDPIGPLESEVVS